MSYRDLYLPTGTALNLTAAATVIGELCRTATADDLRVLHDEGWLTGPFRAGTDSAKKLTGEQIAAARAAAEDVLNRLLRELSASLLHRDVAPFRFDRAGGEGVDAYVTGGTEADGSPTDSYAAWDLVHADHRFPPGWSERIGAAAGLIHPTGTGPAITTVTFHAWA
jgi:hypothetical protein